MKHRDSSDAPPPAVMRPNETENSPVSNDALLVPLLRRVLDEVLSDHRFFAQKSVSAIELAEHVLAQATIGNRDFTHLRNLAFKRIGFEDEHTS